MNNTKVIDAIIESIKVKNYEGALADTYHLQADGRITELKRLRYALKTGQKHMSLAWANCCYGQL